MAIQVFDPHVSQSAPRISVAPLRRSLRIPRFPAGDSTIFHSHAMTHPNQVLAWAPRMQSEVSREADLLGCFLCRARVLDRRESPATRLADCGAGSGRSGDLVCG